jgi:hypothetical protein
MAVASGFRCHALVETQMNRVAYAMPLQGFRPVSCRRLRGLGVGEEFIVPVAQWLSTPSAPDTWTPIWSEQGYVPGAVNPDPSVNANPNPTVQNTVKDLLMVANDPLATNAAYNATDTFGSSSSAAGGIPAWVIAIPVALLAAWVIFKVL